MDAAIDTDLFAGSIAQVYQRVMVPLFFDPYARELAARVAALRPTHVLELAAGTGALTRQLAALLAPTVQIVATDLSDGMLEEARRIGTARPVTWRQADAADLPFADASFDVVACQFGVMFLPDKAAAFAGMRRVLRPGGTLLFSVWDALEFNGFDHAVSLALAQLYPGDPPRFMERIPHGYHDPATIAADLVRGGFTGGNRIETIALPCVADSVELAVQAVCQGTPWRSEIEAREPRGVEAATRAVVAALRERWGSGRVESTMQAHLVTAPAPA